MYVLDPNPVFETTVKVLEPGAVESEVFSATFVALEIEEFNGFDLASPEGTAEFVRRVLYEVDDVVDTTGKPIPCDQALREKLIAIPHVRAALVRAYVDEIGRAARGN